MLGIYKPPNQKETKFLQELKQLFDFHTPVYETKIIIGDLNMAIEDHQFNEFIEMFAFFYHINKPTYYESKYSTYIDLILTNKQNLFCMAILKLVYLTIIS